MFNSVGHQNLKFAYSKLCILQCDPHSEKVPNWSCFQHTSAQGYNIDTKFHENLSVISNVIAA
jgi:hypothetical protein